MRPATLNVDDPKLLKTIEGLAKIQCTQSEAAAVIGVRRETFNRFIARNPVARDTWQAGLEGGKASLRRNQFKLSETNAAMAIWLGKMYLGQREPAREGEEVLGKKEQKQRAAETAGQGTDWGNLLKWEPLN